MGKMRRTAALTIIATAAAAKTPKFEDKWEKFCGVPDCYTELGLFPNATKAQIRRAYRSLSLEFHPDKNPGDQRALRKFNRVARANEVLTDDEQRKKLDYYTENPSEYWSLYGTFVDFSYAPKTSLKGVLFILLVFAALVQPALQYSKYQEYTKALVRAALARAPEGAMFRKEADEIVAEESKKRKKGKKNKNDVPRGKGVSQGNAPEISREERVTGRICVSVTQGQPLRQGGSVPPLDVQVRCKVGRAEKEDRVWSGVGRGRGPGSDRGVLGRGRRVGRALGIGAAQVALHQMLPQGELRQVAVDATGSGVAHEGVDEARDPPAQEGRAGVRHGRVDGDGLVTARSAVVQVKNRKL